MSKKSLLNCEVDSSIIGIDGHQENGPGDNIYQVNLMKDVKKYYTTPLEEEVMDDDDDKMTTATSNDYSNHQGDRLANVADEKMVIKNVYFLLKKKFFLLILLKKLSIF